MDTPLPAGAGDLEVHRLITGVDVVTLDTLADLKTKSSAHYFDRPADAVRIAAVAYRLGQTLPQPAPALGKWALANALLYENRYAEAVELFETARADYLTAHLDLDAARMGVGQVWGLAYAGRFAEAEALANEIEPLLVEAASASTEDLRRLGSLYNNKGILFELTGNYEMALAAYERKIAVAQQLERLQDVARTQHNLVLLYMRLNALEEALAASREAEAGFQAAGMTADLARLYLNRGLLMAAWGRLEDAEEAFRRADAEFSRLDGLDQQRQAATVFRVLVRLQAKESVDPQDCDELQAAQRALAVHGPLFQEALAWIGLGQCRLRLADTGAAGAAYEQALRLGEQGAGRSVRVLALHGLGLAAEQGLQWQEAVGHYRAALEQIEALRHDLHVESFRAGFLADKLVVYQGLTELYTQLGLFDHAYATTEQARARVLAERLAFRLERPAGRRAASSERERSLEQELQQTLLDIERLQTQARMNHGAEPETAEMRQQVLEMEALEDRLLRIARELERATPRLATLHTGPALEAALPYTPPDGACLLQYHVGRGRVGVFVVDSRRNLTHHSLASLGHVEACAQRLRASLERFLALNRDFGPVRMRRFLPALASDANAHLGELFELLMAPVLAVTQTCQKFIVSPDGPLHQVPFHALYNGASFLIERASVSYTPSATILSLCDRSMPTGAGSLVIGFGGDQLPAVDTELRLVAGRTGSATLLAGKDATAAHFLNSVGSFGHIHVASHARFREDNVMLSALSLADRNLSFAEITRLQLSCDLVVLSGCETGQGRALGADVMSLANGFLGAGARSLLVSLWQVDDSVTLRFMDALYRHLAETPDRAEALRRSQLELLIAGRAGGDGDANLAHPACWAPFLLLGSWLPPSSPPPSLP